MAPEKSKYTGMTVNERFFDAGLLDDFDDAARRDDRTRMIELLTVVDLGDEAEAISDAILNHPSRNERLSFATRLWRRISSFNRTGG